MKDTPSAKLTQWLPVEVGVHAPAIEGNALLVRLGQASIEVKPGFDPELLSEILRVLVPLC